MLFESGLSILAAAANLAMTQASMNFLEDSSFTKLTQALITHSRRVLCQL